MPQYLSHAETTGDVGAARAEVEWVENSKILAGCASGSADAKDTRLKVVARLRQKTFANMMAVHNMLVVHTGHGLERYWVPDPHGVWDDPFNVDSFNMAIDMAGDNTCMDHFWGYEVKINNSTDYDNSHGVHNDASKNTLKEVGLWAHQLNMISAMNLFYGSMLSPPRLKAFPSCAAEYFTLGDPNSDAWFQLLLPDLIKQLDLPIQVTDEGASKVFYGIGV